jgi:hypothetical protein
MKVVDVYLCECWGHIVCGNLQGRLEWQCAGADLPLQYLISRWCLVLAPVDDGPGTLRVHNMVLQGCVLCGKPVLKRSTCEVIWWTTVGDPVGHDPQALRFHECCHATCGDDQCTHPVDAS